MHQTPLSNEQDAPDTYAGEFSHWLHGMQDAITTGRGMEVPCGTCQACCQSGYFVPVRTTEKTTLAVIPSRLLITMPGTSSSSDQMIAITRKGDCALFRSGMCSVYHKRPQACREYDCRLFAATGIRTGHEAIDRRINGWRFRYGTAEAKCIESAMKQSADFITRYPQAFPGGRAPTRAAEVAIAAFKTYTVFLESAARNLPEKVIANRIVQASRHFDAKGTWQ